MTKTAFLTGYTGKPTRTPAQLLQLSINLDASVVDSRDAPFSRYLWVQAFGNPTRHQGIITLRNAHAGLKALEHRQIERAIILCACPDGDQCHRKEVGVFLTGHGWTAREVTAAEWAAARVPVGKPLVSA